MSQATTVVMRGYVGTDPRSFQTQNANQRSRGQGCSFRLGAPHGFFDRKHREWRDMPTTWMSVRCFDTLASNATGSLHKGDPVIVAGHLITDEWMSGDQPRSEVILQADAIGHDLNNGISSFTRVHHASMHDDVMRGTSSENENISMTDERGSNDTAGADEDGNGNNDARRENA